MYINEIIKKVMKKGLKSTRLKSWIKEKEPAGLRLVKQITGSDQRLVQTYLKTSSIKKLHVGCGPHQLEGWLNADYAPSSSQILYLDATKRFPFEDHTFDYIFSEHMIEHISYPQGCHMLSECFRILKPNGKIRISTPDLAFLISLYGDHNSEIQMQFIRHSTDRWLRYAPGYQATFVINNSVRNWGHQFIYDEQVLRHSLEQAGFTKLIRRDVCESDEPVFQNLENVKRKPPGLISAESLVIEAIKPKL